MKKFLALLGIGVFSFALMGCTSTEVVDVEEDDNVVVEDAVVEEAEEMSLESMTDEFFKAFSEGTDVAYAMMTERYHGEYTLEMMEFSSALLMLGNYSEMTNVTVDGETVMGDFNYSTGEVIPFTVMWVQNGDDWEVDDFQMTM